MDRIEKLRDAAQSVLTQRNAEAGRIATDGFIADVRGDDGPSSQVRYIDYAVRAGEARMCEMILKALEPEKDDEGES